MGRPVEAGEGVVARTSAGEAQPLTSRRATTSNSSDRTGARVMSFSSSQQTTIEWPVYTTVASSSSCGRRCCPWIRSHDGGICGVGRGKWHQLASTHTQNAPTLVLSGEGHLFYDKHITARHGGWARDEVHGLKSSGSSWPGNTVRSFGTRNSCWEPAVGLEPTACGLRICATAFLPPDSMGTDAGNIGI